VRPEGGIWMSAALVTRQRRNPEPLNLKTQAARWFAAHNSNPMVCNCRPMTNLSKTAMQPIPSDGHGPVLTSFIDMAMPLFAARLRRIGCLSRRTTEAAQVLTGNGFGIVPLGQELSTMESEASMGSVRSICASSSRGRARWATGLGVMSFR
jgi:hypothetical protein